LIKQLRHLQHDLNSKLRSEKFIHNKLINACQNVFACQYVCFKPSDSLTNLINDLKLSIIIYQKINSTNFIETFETFFFDRRIIKIFHSDSTIFRFELIRIVVIFILRRRNVSFSSVIKKNVDQRNIQKMNVKRQSRNSKIVSIDFSSELIITFLNIKDEFIIFLFKRRFWYWSRRNEDINNEFIIFVIVLKFK
jgi:hypothetical protein